MNSRCNNCRDAFCTAYFTAVNCYTVAQIKSRSIKNNAACFQGGCISRKIAIAVLKIINLVLKMHLWIDLDDCGGFTNLEKWGQRSNMVKTVEPSTTAPRRVRSC